MSRLKTPGWWERYLPPEVTPAMIRDWELQSLLQPVMAAARMNPFDEIFSNDEGCWNVTLMHEFFSKVHRKGCREFGPVDFELREEYVSHVEQHCDLDPRHLGPAKPTDRIRPVIILLCPGKYQLEHTQLDGTHRIVRLWRSGITHCRAWMIHERVADRFKIRMFNGGNEIDYLAETKADYGKYFDWKTNTVHVPGDPEKEARLQAIMDVARSKA